MKIKFFLKEKSTKIIVISLILGFLFFLVLPLLHIQVRSVPYIFNDEFGYWATAANFAGYDWSNTFSKIPYYSYGYGLILMPLILLSPNMMIAYKMALMLNGVWLGLSFIFMYKSAKQLFIETNQFILILASFTATIFSSNIAEVNYTWPEVFLFFLFTLSVYFVILLVKNPSKLKLSLVGIITAFSYFVHQRTLGICIATILVIFLLRLLKKVNTKQVLFFFIPLIVFVILFSLIKADVISSIWKNGDLVSTNNFSGQAQKVASIFSIEGIKKLILSFGGKIYYIFGATYFIVPLSIISIFTRWIFPNKKLEIDSHFLVGTFLILSFLFSIGINCISLITPGNITHIVYGRYTDNLLGIFLLIGILELYNYGVNVKKNVCLVLLFLVLSILVNYSVGYFNLRYRAAINSIGISYIVEQDYIEIIKGIVFVVGFWTMLQLIRKILINNKNLLFVCMSLSLTATFIVVGINAYNAFELDWSDAAQSSEKCYEIISNLEEEANFDIGVYAIMEDEGYPLRYTGNGIQFLLKDKPVFSISQKEAFEKKWDDNAVIIASARTEVLEGFYTIYNDGTYELMVPINSGLENVAQQKAEMLY